MDQVAVGLVVLVILWGIILLPMWLLWLGRLLDHAEATAMEAETEEMVLREGRRRRIHSQACSIDDPPAQGHSAV